VKEREKARDRLVQKADMVHVVMPRRVGG